MSCTVLKKKCSETPSVLSVLARDANAVWESVTSAINVNRASKGDFRIPEPLPAKKPKGSGVGYSYKKTGSIRK
jgi:hypothetical protein